MYESTKGRRLTRPNSSYTESISRWLALRRLTGPRLALYGVLATVLYFLLRPITQIPLWPETSLQYTLKSTSPLTAKYKEMKMTKVLNHQPGFTLIENLYWANGTYIFMTDQPWSIPTLPHIASFSVNNNKPTGGKVVSKIYAIRGDPASPEVDEGRQLGSSITPEQALAFNDAIELPSPMMINNDDNFVNHFYHWIGENFLGQWRIWSNYVLRTGEELPKVKTVVFMQQWTHEAAPDGAAGGEIWEDRPGANVWYTEKFFPGVTIESRSEWNARAATGQLYRIPLVSIGDRAAGHRGPSAAFKPFGDALRMPVPHDWYLTLRDRILAGYKGPVSLKKGPLPKVLYLTRQDSSRRLMHEDHDRLVEALNVLHKEGIAEVVIEYFSPAMPFEDQVAKISTVDIFLSVHGNGLTHILWMDAGPQSGVFEFQPADCTVTDYSPLAMSVGLTHHMVHTDSFCYPLDCPKRGCTGNHPKSINRDDIQVDAKMITDEIRKLIAKGKGKA